jgi:hypothetical protein
MGASSGWNLATRRPPRVRAVPAVPARTVVRPARVSSGGAARQVPAERPRGARDGLHVSG